MFTVVIFGSRHYTDQEAFDAHCDRLLSGKHPDIEIVEGDCRGPDQMAKDYARRRGYSHQCFPADWDKFGKGAGFRRNRQMAIYVADQPDRGAIAFWDGISHGTAMMIDLLGQRGVPVKVITIPPPAPGKPMAATGILKTSSQAAPVDRSAPPTITHPDQITAGIPRQRKPKPIVVDGVELVVKPKAPRKKKPVPAGDSTWKERYEAAHRQWFVKEYPSAWKDGHYLEPNYPKVRESNGMQTAIVNYLNWLGHRAKRINNMGRMVDGVDVTESGAKIIAKKWIPSAAGKGQADISGTIYGRSTQLEVKAGNDKPSAAQLKEQAKERKAGGCYEFIYSIEQFFAWYDSLAVQSDLFESK